MHLSIDCQWRIYASILGMQHGLFNGGEANNRNNQTEMVVVSFTHSKPTKKQHQRPKIRGKPKRARIIY